MKTELWRPRDLNGGGHQSCPGSVRVRGLVVGEHLRVGHDWEEIGDRHWLVTRRARSTRADAAAEATAVRAILLTEVAGCTRWAFIDGAWPRRSGWDRRLRCRVPAPPRCLAARRGAEALSANPVERTPAHSAGHRRSAIVTRPDFKRHDQPHVRRPAA